jgi:hypothetical protein
MMLLPLKADDSILRLCSLALSSLMSQAEVMRTSSQRMNPLLHFEPLTLQHLLNCLLSKLSSLARLASSFALKIAASICFICWRRQLIYRQPSVVNASRVPSSLRTDWRVEGRNQLSLSCSSQQSLLKSAKIGVDLLRKMRTVSLFLRRRKLASPVVRLLLI